MFKRRFESARTCLKHFHKSSRKAGTVGTTINALFQAATVVALTRDEVVTAYSVMSSRPVACTFEAAKPFVAALCRKLQRPAALPTDDRWHREEADLSHVLTLFFF